jgi:hypothetical protein
MYKSSLRHTHDPVLSSLQMKGIRFFVYICHLLVTYYSYMFTVKLHAMSAVNDYKNNFFLSWPNLE